MDETQVVKNRHFVAALTDKDYIKLRVEIAQTGATLKGWITQAIRDRLKTTEEDK